MPAWLGAGAGAPGKMNPGGIITVLIPWSTQTGLTSAKSGSVTTPSDPGGPTTTVVWLGEKMGIGKPCENAEKRSQSKGKRECLILRLLHKVKKAEWSGRAEPQPLVSSPYNEHCYERSSGGAS